MPLVLRWAGNAKSGQRISKPASVLDIGVTVVKAAGGTLANTDGFDLLHLPSDRAVYFKAYYDDPGFGVRREQWKFYRNYKGVSTQLYDIMTDKGETKNVAASNPAVVAELNGLLDKFIAALKN